MAPHEFSVLFIFHGTDVSCNACSQSQGEGKHLSALDKTQTTLRDLRFRKTQDK